MNKYNFASKCSNYMISNTYELLKNITHSFDMSLVLVVGQACNLKCKNCGNFCPISLPETRRYEIKSIIESLQIILDNVWHMNYLQIQGGEPFVYGNLPELLAFLQQQKKVKSIEIATNGMVMPADDILHAIKNDKRIGIRISDYKLSQAPIRLEARLKEMGIPVKYYRFAGETGEWTDLGGIDVLPVDDAETISHFDACAFNTCLTLENGELTYCSRATNAYKLQGFTRNNNDYLVVRNVAGFKQSLRDFVTNKHAMEACRYCNGTAKGEKIRPAIQMKVAD